MEAQKTLRAATLPINNIIELYQDASGKTRLSGLDGQYMTIVLNALGKSYEIVHPEDSQYGSLQPDGNFSGMIGMLQKEEADLAFSIIRMSIQRQKAVDFSRTYSMESLKFVGRKPGHITPIFAFLYPFDVHIWVSILMCIFVLSTIGKVLDRRSSWGHNFLKTVSNVLKQPLEMGDSSLKWRFLIGFWGVFTLVISSCYSSALLSFLTIPLQEKAIENFLQLSQAVQAGTHKCYILKASAHKDVLQTSNDDIKILTEFIERNNWYYSYLDIGSDKFIDHSSVIAAGRLVSELSFGFRKDKYLISKDVMAVAPVAIALSKNFCCKAKLNVILSRIEGSGIYNKLLQDVSLKLSLSKVDDAVEETFKPLTVRDLSGCFMILVVGWALSFVVFGGEIIYFAVFKTKKSHKM